MLVLFLAASSWGYHGSKGPSNWYKTYPNCNKTRQSPIQLLESSSEYKDFSAFKFNGYSTVPSSRFTIENNAHTVQVTLMDSTGLTVNAFGKTFKPWQIHFHWGATDSVGSEHTMKSDASHLHPGEMHFVHVNTAYATTADALNQYDGLMVFGTVMEVDKTGKNNTFISKLTAHMKDITLAKTKVNMSAFALNDAFMVDKTKFFHYNGSLTTPQCNEAVQWVVFTEDMKVTHAQMEDFRKLLHTETVTNVTAEYLSNNYRPIQNRNGRSIYRSFKSGSPESTRVSIVAMVMSFIVYVGFTKL
eukprot:Seg52.1 transcript_id=Seg52.1/GoldUCD/mRNA.D3Y31 product="Carbonic anhydrase 2" protein_id=Seg52.1/GoldUCD/D3Y31